MNGLVLAAALLSATLALGACSGTGWRGAPAAAAAAAPARVVLHGEQHDAPLHHQRHRELVEALAARGELAALALEMVEQGASTAALPPGASEAEVRQALRWNEAGWPWAAYGPAVMAAVRAGIPVIGANLPRERMRAAMADAALDGALDAQALADQREAIRAGHCGLLPDTQLAPMARVQIARDRAMADTVAAAAQPGRTVLLIAGAGHVDPRLGVPRHLPAGLQVEPLALPAQPSGKDYCEELRRQMPQRPAPKR